MQSTKFVTSVTWIKRGVCQEKADKPSTEEMQSDSCEYELDEDELDEEESELEGETDDAEASNSSQSDTADDDGDEFDFKHYDDDDVDDNEGLFNGLACFRNNNSDPYMTIKDEEDISDDEYTQIKPDDNVLVIANIKKDNSCLDFYVYNEAQEDCFIHHSIPIIITPICTEWIGYRPDTSGPGNFLAVGNMTPKIEFWSVDDVNALQPMFTLGKKYTKTSSLKEGPLNAILDLAWNSTIGNVLASGSADSTVKLWDMSNGKTLATISQFENKVQTLQWHPFEANNLLSGSCDKKARLFDCRNPMRASREWLCDGEVERVVWNHFDPFYCLASSDNGMVHCFDARATASVWTLSAHPSAAVTGLSLSSSCPGCLITASMDESIKIWDILDKKPGLVYEEKLKVKRIFYASASPDSPFVLCCGGDNKNHNFKIVDLSQVEVVMKKFKGRPLVGIDRSTAFLSEKESRVGEVEARAKYSKPRKDKTKYKMKKKTI